MYTQSLPGADWLQPVGTDCTACSGSQVRQLTLSSKVLDLNDAFNTYNADNERLYANNTVEAVVGSDGKLTIGLRKDVQIENDWTIWDNWQLFYLGKSDVIVGDANGDGEVNITDVSIMVDYVLNGSTELIKIANADMNGDGDVNITDVSALVSMILNQE